MIIRIIDFPDCKSKAMLIRDSYDEDNVYLNARLSREEQMKGLRHELFHIENGDLDSDEGIQTIEYRAHSCV